MKNRLTFALTVTFLLLLELFFFRNIIFNDSLFGDIGDGKLTTLIAEHWWSFFAGKERFAELLILYPIKNSAGYTDMLLGFGIIHSIFRFLSLNMFSAYKWTLIVVHAFGTFSTYYLCRKKLKISTVWSLFATVAFSFSNAYSVHSTHTQLYAVSILPLITILIINIINQNIKKEKYNFPTYCALFFFILLMYNSWYIAYFCILFVTIFVLTYAIICILCKISLKPFIKRFIEILPNTAGYVLFSLILLIPFVYIYFPAMNNTNGFSYSEALYYMPQIIDFINVGEKNLLLGNLMQRMKLGSFDNIETIIGYSLVLSFLFLVSMFIAFYKIREIFKNEKIEFSEKYYLLTIVCVYVTVVICLMLITKGPSLWYIIYKFLGGNTIRAVSRFAFWLTFPIAIITAYTADKFWKFKTKTNIPIILLILLWITNIHTPGIYSNWQVNKIMQFINRVSSPPAKLESFFIVNNDYGYPHNIVENVDAYMIATAFHIKTINGYSGSYPQRYHLLNKKYYLYGVQQWLYDHHLNNVYAYDVAENKWIPYNEYINQKILYKPDEIINFTSDNDNLPFLTHGFSIPEQPHTWTDGATAELSFNIGKTDKRLLLTIQAFPFISDNIKFQTVKVYANDTEIAEWIVDKDDIYTAIIPNNLVKNGLLTLKFDISNPTNPIKEHISNNNRELGLAFKTLLISDINERNIDENL